MQAFARQHQKRSMAECVRLKVTLPARRFVWDVLASRSIEKKDKVRPQIAASGQQSLLERFASFVADPVPSAPEEVLKRSSSSIVREVHARNGLVFEDTGFERRTFVRGNVCNDSDPKGLLCHYVVVQLEGPESGQAETEHIMALVVGYDRQASKYIVWDPPETEEERKTCMHLVPPLLVARFPRRRKYFKGQPVLARWSASESGELPAEQLILREWTTALYPAEIVRGIDLNLIYIRYLSEPVGSEKRVHVLDVALCPRDGEPDEVQLKMMKKDIRRKQREVKRRQAKGEAVDTEATVSNKMSRLKAHEAAPEAAPKAVKPQEAARVHATSSADTSDASVKTAPARPPKTPPRNSTPADAPKRLTPPPDDEAKEKKPAASPLPKQTPARVDSPPTTDVKTDAKTDVKTDVETAPKPKETDVVTSARKASTPDAAALAATAPATEAKPRQKADLAPKPEPPQSAAGGVPNAAGGAPNAAGGAPNAAGGAPSAAGGAPNAAGGAPRAAASAGSFRIRKVEKTVAASAPDEAARSADGQAGDPSLQPESGHSKAVAAAAPALAAALRGKPPPPTGALPPTKSPLRGNAATQRAKSPPPACLSAAVSTHSTTNPSTGSAQTARSKSPVPACASSAEAPNCSSQVVKGEAALAAQPPVAAPAASAPAASAPAPIAAPPQPFRIPKQAVERAAAPAASASDTASLSAIPRPRTLRSSEFAAEAARPSTLSRADAPRPPPLPHDAYTSAPVPYGRVRPFSSLMGAAPRRAEGPPSPPPKEVLDELNAWRVVLGLAPMPSAQRAKKSATEPAAQASLPTRAEPDAEPKGMKRPPPLASQPNGGAKGPVRFAFKTKRRRQRISISAGDDDAAETVEPMLVDESSGPAQNALPSTHQSSPETAVANGPSRDSQQHLPSGGDAEMADVPQKKERVPQFMKLVAA